MTHRLVLRLLFQQDFGVSPDGVMPNLASIPEQVVEVLPHFPLPPLLLGSLLLELANLLLKEELPASHKFALSG